MIGTLDVFRRGASNVEKMNRPHIFFLPKCQGDIKVENFRPISLSNSIFLVIAKVLAN